MRMLSFAPSCSWGAVRNSKSIQDAVRAAQLIFESSAIPEPVASAEYLAISSFDKVQRRRAALASTNKPDASELENYIALCKQRAQKRVPIQYLVGDWDFHNITLRVRAPVLIPRPETEELVEHLLSDVRAEGARILDIGCGSGAILLAALKARPGWSGVGVDIADEALTLSAENARLLGVEDRADFVAGTIGTFINKSKFDALVSNPPYISTHDMEQLEAEVKDHEDYRALCGGEDGLDVVLQIMKDAPQVVHSGGSIWLEVDSSHPAALEKIDFPGLQFISKLDDMYGNARFCQWRVT